MIIWETSLSSQSLALVMTT